MRGTPMSVGNLEEIIDDNHAIVSTSVGSEHYVSILSFVDKDQLEPGCSVLLNHKVHAVVGVLSDDTDPMVAVMKLEKAPTESYADIGGLDTQIQVNQRFKFFFLVGTILASALLLPLICRRSRNRWSCPSPTPSTMRRWGSSRPRG